MTIEFQSIDECRLDLSFLLSCLVGDTELAKKRV